MQVGFIVSKETLFTKFREHFGQRCQYFSSYYLTIQKDIPETWNNKDASATLSGIHAAAADTRNQTRTGLMENRKKANAPNLTYDLDNDGAVCAKEYFIARRFDKDADGNLEPEEKTAAIAALKKGYEDKFYWGVERLGALRGKRLMQIRGKIVDAEDFIEVCDTYPRHPISQNKSMVSTMYELNAKRKQGIGYF